MLREIDGFYDIYSYHYVPFAQTLFGKIVIGVIVGLFIGLLVLLFFFLRKKRQLPFWQKSINEIRSLLMTVDVCQTQEDIKKYYFALTEVIKKYFHDRYGWQTCDKTDEELVPYLSKQRFAKELLDNLKKILEGAQCIKFAKEDVIKIQAKSDAEEIIKIILKTKPNEKRS